VPLPRGERGEKEKRKPGDATPLCSVAYYVRARGIDRARRINRTEEESTAWRRVMEPALVVIAAVGFVGGVLFLLLVWMMAYTILYGHRPGERR